MSEVNLTSIQVYDECGADSECHEPAYFAVRAPGEYASMLSCNEDLSTAVTMVLLLTPSDSVFVKQYPQEVHKHVLSNR